MDQPMKNMRGKEDWQKLYDSEKDRLNPKTLRNSFSLMKTVYKEQTGAKAPEIDMHLTKSGTYIYFISDGEYVKIGIASLPRQRLANLQTSNARKLKILFLVPQRTRSEALIMEKQLHTMFGEDRLEGEWFDILDKLDMIENLGMEVQ